MKLYRLLNQLGIYYVVANDPTDAENRLMSLLNRADYGFSDKRKVREIEVLAEELNEFPRGKPNFSSGHSLILPDTCEEHLSLNTKEVPQS